RSIHRYLKRFTCDWITHLERRRAARDLSTIPSWNDIIDERIVHPLTHFMTQRMYVLNRHVENTRIAVCCHANGQLIRRYSKSCMEAENAAVTVFCEKRVVREKDRETRRRDALYVLYQPCLEEKEGNLAYAGTWSIADASKRFGNDNRLKRHHEGS